MYTAASQPELQSRPQHKVCDYRSLESALGYLGTRHLFWCQQFLLKAGYSSASTVQSLTSILSEPPPHASQVHVLTGSHTEYLPDYLSHIHQPMSGPG